MDANKNDITEVKIENGYLIIKARLKQDPVISASAKSFTIASSHGNQKVNCEFEGKQITVGFNAYVPNPDRPRR